MKHRRLFLRRAHTTLNFVVNGVNAVCLFVMRSTISGNMVVPLDNTTLAYNSCDEKGFRD